MPVGLAAVRLDPSYGHIGRTATLPREAHPTDYGSSLPSQIVGFWTGVDTSPVNVVLTQLDMPAKRRPTIVLNLLNHSMLHGIPMDVIDASFQIVLVADGVFPTPTLPNRSFAFLDP